MAFVPCPNCSSLVPEEASVCPKCGATLEQSDIQRETVQDCKAKVLEAKIDAYLDSIRGLIPPQAVADLRQRMRELPLGKVERLTETAALTKPSKVLLLSVFLGWIGVDRFVLGEVALGVIKAVTCGGCGVWTVLDWFIIRDNTRKANYKKLISLM